MAQNINITNLKIEVKKNGIFLKITSDKPILKGTATGWYSENGWFYLTIMNSSIDTNLVGRINYPAPIQTISFHNSAESVQISLAVPIIETHEFSWYGNPIELEVSLRYPIETIKPVFAEATLSNQNNPSLATKLNYSRMRTAAMLIGVSLSVSGIVDSDGQDSISWELPTGLGLLIATYFYDRYIRLNK